MGWESNPPEEHGDGKDRAWMVWVGIGVAIAAMGGLMLMNRPDVASYSRAKVTHILIMFNQNDPADDNQAFELITQLRDRAIAGEDFASMAKQYSDDEVSAPKGGNLGWVDPEFLTGPVDSYVWTAEVGRVSEVILSEFGYHIVVVEDREISYTEQYERELHDRVIEGASSGDADE